MQNQDSLDNNLKPKSNMLIDLTAGFFAGLASFLVAIILVPKQTLSIHDYDMHLSVRLALLYAALTSCWFINGRTVHLPRLSKGLLIGIGLGICYACLCTKCMKSPAMMLLYPPFLSAALNLFIQASVCRPVFSPRSLRICSDGLFAGFALGLTYALLLNLGGLYLGYVGFLYFQDLSMPKYVQAMSFGGPFAFGLASGLFFVLLRRSCNFGDRPFASNFAKESARLLLILSIIALSNWRVLLR